MYLDFLLRGLGSCYAWVSKGKKHGQISKDIPGANIFCYFVKVKDEMKER